MAPFSDLPTELIQMICDFLYEEMVQLEWNQLDWDQLDRNGLPVRHPICTARDALRYLCLVSSRYCSIAQPFLWKMCCDGVNAAQLFLQAAVRYPSLAVHVERVSLFQIAYLRWSGWIIETSELANAIRPFDIDFAEDWIDRLRYDKSISGHGAMEAIVALYLALLPRMKFFRFRWLNDDSDILGKLAASRERLPGCKVIEELDIRDPECPGRGIFQKGVALLTLPSLKRLKTHGVAEIYPNQLLPASLEITHINYFHPVVEVQSLPSLLTACKEVEHVLFGGISPDAVAFLPSAILLNLTMPTPYMVVDIFRTHRASLKSLVLDFSEFFWYMMFRPGANPDWGETMVSIPSLQEFHALEHLTFDQQSLTCDVERTPGAWVHAQLLIELLPTSIQTLTIHGANMVLHAALGCLAVTGGQDGTQFPHLRSITIQTDRRRSGRITELYSSFQDRFEEANIMYQVSREPPLRHSPSYP